MGRTTGTAGTERATGTASIIGELPDTATGPPRTSCSKLQQKKYRGRRIVLFYPSWRQQQILLKK